jgi:hypothetical protein
MATRAGAVQRASNIVWDVTYDNQLDRLALLYFGIELEERMSIAACTSEVGILTPASLGQSLYGFAWALVLSIPKCSRAVVVVVVVFWGASSANSPARSIPRILPYKTRDLCSTDAKRGLRNPVAFPADSS